MPNTEIIRQYFKRFFSGKARQSDVRDMVTDDFCFRGPLMRADSADEYVQLVTAMGDEIEMHAEVREIVGQGDVVAALVDFKGPKGPITYSQWFYLRGGKIAGLEVTYDPRSFL